VYRSNGGINYKAEIGRMRKEMEEIKRKEEEKYKFDEFI
jgi:hypothetical protein